MPSTYTQLDIDLALRAITLAGGNCERAHKNLKAAGFDKPLPTVRTLQNWLNWHAERYEQIRNDESDELWKRAASESEALILASAVIERKALTKLDEKLDADDLKADQIASVLRNVSTSKALQADKIAGPAREKPAYMKHNNSPEELASKIARALGFTDSTAVEEPPTDQALLREGSPSNVREDASSSTS